MKSADGASELAAKVKDSLAAVFEKWSEKVVAAYLFGSSVNGAAGPESDIDLAILLHNEAASAAAGIRIDLYLDCSRALKRNDIDIVVLNRTRNLFLLNEIVRNGVLLFDTDPDSRIDFEVKTLHDFIEFRDHRKKVMGV